MLGVGGDDDVVVVSMGVATDVGGPGLDPAGGGLGEGDLAPLGEDRLEHVLCVGGRRVEQAEDLGGHLPVRLLHLRDLLGGVDVDEVPLLLVAEPVGLEDRVERLLDGHVVEVGGDDALDVLGRDDVPLALEREHAEDLDEVGLVDVDLDGAAVGDADLVLGDGLAFVGRGDGLDGDRLGGRGVGGDGSDGGDVHGGEGWCRDGGLVDQAHLGGVGRRRVGGRGCRV